MFLAWLGKCLARFPSGGVPGYWHWLPATICLGLALAFSDLRFISEAIRSQGVPGLRFVIAPLIFLLSAVTLYVYGYRKYRQSTESAEESKSTWLFKPFKGLLWTLAIVTPIVAPFNLTGGTPKEPVLYVLALIAAFLFFSFERKK